MNKKQALIILISTFLFVVFWIIFNIYHSIVTSTISEDTNMQITPISPNFDTKTIKKLKQREVVIPIYEIAGSTLGSPTNTVVPTPTISTSSATVSTSGGNLTP